MTEPEPFTPYYGEEFSWEEVEEARNNLDLQRQHSLREGQSKYGGFAKPCPKCQTPAAELIWLYYESEPWTWETWECGRAGWMTACDKCHVLVHFFLEKMS